VGTYYCRLRGSNGKRTWHALGDDLEIAKERFADLKARGAAPHPKATIRELTLRWLAVYVPTLRISRNVISTTNAAERHLFPFFGDTLARKLTKDRMREYRLYLEGKGLEPTTVRHLLADVCCMLRWAADAGYIDSAPIPKGLLPVLQEQPPKGLDDEQVRRVTALPDPLGFTCRLLLGSGMRWGELIRAQASDIGKDGRLTITRTKSRKVRKVPLPPELLEECRGRVGKLVHWNVPCSDTFNRQVIKQAKVEGFHAHRLRHTMAYRWIERGGELAALMRVLGHASLTMTLRYARADDRMVTREAERVHAAGLLG